MISRIVCGAMGLILAVGCITPATPQPSPSPTPEPAAIVVLTDTTIEPSVADIRTGDTLRWTNEGTITHTVTSGNPNDPAPGAVFDLELAPGDSVDFLFNVPGPANFVYFDRHSPTVLFGARIVILAP